jgi:glucose-6-phosphate dehydrogenase assembly protein OpcA
VSTIDVGFLLDKLEEHRGQREAASITTAFNLVAFVEDDPQLAQLIAARIAQIEERNPSRTIVLACDERDASVQSEHVQIAVQGIEAMALRSIVHDLIVPNVRTVLLWAGSRVSDQRFDALASLADVVIVFSSVRENGVDMLRDIVRLRGTPAEHKLRDLAFLRLFAWQDTVAQFFDDADLACELPHINRIDVQSGSLPEAYYFVGWLASRLGWKPCGENEFCNAEGNSITISLDQGGAPRRVYRVCLHSAHCVFGATIHPDSDDVICLSVCGEKHRAEQYLPLHDVDMVSLIERAIFNVHEQGIYLETLEMVERLLAHVT